MKYLHPKRIIRITKECLYNFFWYYLLPDRLEIQYHFRKKLGYKCNLDNPQTFNEKIQWLKLNDRNPRYPSLIDKYRVKDIIVLVIGGEHVVKTIGGVFARL